MRVLRCVSVGRRCRGLHCCRHRCGCLRDSWDDGASYRFRGKRRSMPSTADVQTHSCTNVRMRIAASKRCISSKPEKERLECGALQNPRSPAARHACPARIFRKQQQHHQRFHPKHDPTLEPTPSSRSNRVAFFSHHQSLNLQRQSVSLNATDECMHE